MPRSRQQDASGDAEIVKNVAVCAVWGAAHGIDDMFVETGEKSEAVLTGKRETAVPAGIWNGDTARLAAEHRLALVDMHLEAALGQFMRRA